VKSINKKTISLVLIIILLIPLSSGNKNMVKNTIKKRESDINKTSDPPPINIPFVYGSTATPYVIDPVDCWDSHSSLIIDQVAETLFTYNYSDESLPIKPLLATGYTLEPTKKLNYTITLRQGVTFHDGTPWNATAAKWNFDRMDYWWNMTGDLPMSEYTGYPTALFIYDDSTPIWNATKVIDDYTIRIGLTRPYAPFISLLTYSATAMVSPKSTPLFKMLNFTSGLIGTGPFEFDYYITGNETKFHSYDNYWRGKADIGDMRYRYYNSFDNLSKALMSGEVHFIRQVDYRRMDYLDSWKSNPNITVWDEGKTREWLNYLHINNKLLNSTIRKAIAHAINYTHILDYYYNTTQVRAKSCLPNGMLYYNGSLNYPQHNIPLARSYMQSIGHGIGLDPNFPGSDEAAWKLLAENTMRFNYSFWVYYPSLAYHDMFDLYESWLELIGININMKESYWGEFIWNMRSDPDWVDIWYFGWVVECNDPDNLLRFTLIDSNDNVFSQINDPYLESLVTQGREEYDPNLRKTIYDEIQRYCIEVSLPFIPISLNKLYHAHSIYLSGFQQNIFDRIYFYECEWNPPQKLEHIIYIDDMDPFYNWQETVKYDWCTGSGTWNDPYVIKDRIIDGSGYNYCIEIRNSDAYFVIQNCTLTNGILGNLWLYNVSHSLITENKIHASSIAGIKLTSNCYNVSIYNNALKNNGYGIEIWVSSEIFIKKNNITRGHAGIITSYGVEQLSIIDNKIFHILYAGIALGSSHNSTIKNNEIYNTTETGISLVYSHSNETIIKQNTITDSNRIGIFLGWGATQNKIYNNTFIGNSLHAHDNSSNNAWDYKGIGNYWDDYLGSDLDDDGIGDDGYLINGTAGSIDNFPIWDDGPDQVPEITIISPDTYDLLGHAAPTFEVDISVPDLNASWYSIDGGITTINFTGNTGIIDQDEWDKKQNGTVIIVFYANNTKGYVGSAQVSIYKDVLGPDININVPDNGDTFEDTPPVYDISINEANLDSIWYTLDGGTINHTITENVGTIAESAWNSLPNGYITITFYANDTLGNQGTNFVIVVKDVPEIPEEFPWEITTIISISSAAAVVIIIMIFIRRRTPGS
jgi:parallel beta-helix repeat protein